MLISCFFPDGFLDRSLTCGRFDTVIARIDKRLHCALVTEVLSHVPKLGGGLKIVEWQIEFNCALLIYKVIQEEKLNVACKCTE